MIGIIVEVVVEDGEVVVAEVDVIMMIMIAGALGVYFYTLCRHAIKLFLKLP